MDRSGVTVKEITPSIATLATHFPDSFSADPADRLIVVIVRGRLEPEVGALLVQALAAARETLYQRARRAEGAAPADPSAAPPSLAQQQADALALLAETALRHELDPGAPGERYQVVVHVDAAVLADPAQPGQSVLEEGGNVSAETSRRLACDASRVLMRHDEVRHSKRDRRPPTWWPGHRRSASRCQAALGKLSQRR